MTLLRLTGLGCAIVIAGVASTAAASEYSVAVGCRPETGKQIVDTRDYRFTLLVGHAENMYMRRQVRASLSAPSRPAIINPFAGTLRGVLALAASFILIVTIVVGWRVMMPRTGGGDAPEPASAIVDAHLRSLQPGHLTDVISSDQHTVKPWFDGKIDFAPGVRDFQAEGFPLQGGRLDIIRGRTVAAVVYARRKHLINVFIWPTTGNDSSASSGSLYGYHWIRWRKDKMEMWAVSDVNAADLGELQSLLAK